MKISLLSAALAARNFLITKLASTSEFDDITADLIRACKEPRAEWLCPTEYPPPRGIKLQVLTWGGIGTEGHWDQTLYAAWSPMPDTPQHIKHRMMLWATGRKSELGIE
jgi:hypothetical protein